MQVPFTKEGKVRIAWICGLWIWTFEFVDHKPTITFTFTIEHLYLSNIPIRHHLLLYSGKLGLSFTLIKSPFFLISGQCSLFHLTRHSIGRSGHDTGFPWHIRYPDICDSTAGTGSGGHCAGWWRRGGTRDVLCETGSGGAIESQVREIAGFICLSIAMIMIII